jgi:hypothetical protein
VLEWWDPDIIILMQPYMRPTHASAGKNAKTYLMTYPLLLFTDAGDPFDPSDLTRDRLEYGCGTPWSTSSRAPNAAAGSVLGSMGPLPSSSSSSEINRWTSPLAERDAVRRSRDIERTHAKMTAPGAAAATNGKRFVI